jgi:hypothetical protein
MHDCLGHLNQDFVLGFISKNQKFFFVFVAVRVSALDGDLRKNCGIFVSILLRDWFSHVSNFGSPNF